jgi:cytochrome c-type biogenesis protein CcmH
MIFWITAVLLSLAIAAIFALTLMRTRGVGEHPAAYDLKVYRDQLREVDRDLARGIITPDTADRVRAEIGRRVLAADAQVQKAASGAPQPRGATLVLAALVAAAVIGGSFALYPVLGDPGARDEPIRARIAAADAAHNNRPSQAKAEADLPPRPSTSPEPEHAALMKKLRETVAARPDDLQGHLLLVRNEAALGNFKAAYTAQQEVIALKGAKANAADYTMLAELLMSATEGYISPEAEAALTKALKLSPRYAPARYYTGLMLIQNDRPDLAFRFWRRLLEEGPADAPWMGPIRSNIEELAARAGVRYTPPDAPAPAAPTAGPSAADIAAAANMSPEERAEFVQGMVSRLNDRLAREGGTPEEWAQLIGALGALGKSERAAAIWAEAQQKFADKPGAIAIVERGARRAGLLSSDADAAPLTGPSQEDIANAATMQPEDRQAMIRAMVSGLAERLAQEGGSADEWARLITSQATLGNAEAAQQAYADARAAFKGDIDALAKIDAAAIKAGIDDDP